MKPLNTKINLFLVAIMMSLVFVGCKDNTDEPPPPIEKEEMFPFLKVGNVFTYQYDYPVECGTGYAANITEISIDSIIIIDSVMMYYGTNTFYIRSRNWREDDKIDTEYVYTNNNVLLFILKNFVVNFVFADSLKIPHNFEIGTTIDSMVNYDNEKIYCKFDEIKDYSVFKQTDNYDSESILYKNCFLSFNSCSKNWGQGCYSSIWQNYVYNASYGLISIDKGVSCFTGADGHTLSLIEINHYQ